MAKRRVGRYPKAFRKMAVERLKGCGNIIELSKELGVHRRLLYKWRDQLEPIDDGQAPPENSRERELRLQVGHLKRVVADKTLEADFFKGALQKVVSFRYACVGWRLGCELRRMGSLSHIFRKQGIHIIADPVTEVVADAAYFIEPDD